MFFLKKKKLTQLLFFLLTKENNFEYNKKIAVVRHRRLLRILNEIVT